MLSPQHCSACTHGTYHGTQTTQLAQGQRQGKLAETIPSSCYQCNRSQIIVFQKAEKKIRTRSSAKRISVRFSEGSSQISASTEFTVFTVIKAKLQINTVNTINTVPAEISRGPFRKSYRNSVCRRSRINSYKITSVSYMCTWTKTCVQL